MKHFLFVLALWSLALGTGFAQRLPAGRTAAPASEYEAPTTTFADSINAVFRNLDKSRVASGILEDYGLQFIDHAPFTGTGGFTADNQLDLGRWRALYGDLYGARINGTAAGMASLAAVNQALAQYAPEPSVELPILHFTYHRFRPDAVSSGRLRSVRNRLADVPGQDPYQPATMFGVAASATELPSATPAFIFRPGLFFTNTGRTVASLQADFADGFGFVGLSWDVARPVSYATAGPKDVRVRVSYTDGSTWESHLLVVAPAPAPLARYSGTPSFAPFTLIADRAYSGPAASARITVEYGGRNKANPDPAVLDKPLIVVKGFDVSGIIGGPAARSTYSRFAASISDPNTNQSILSDGADLDGYDIVYVDFDNGTDYLQNNAFLLERVIRWVNQNKTGTQPNAMLTMSMGGLIAQYALRDIETHPANTAYPHQVRLLITHDSPHQGANAPLSLQLAIRKLAGTVISTPIGGSIALVDLVPVLGQGRDALLSPAAQQLLRYQTQRLVGTFGWGGTVVAAPTSLYDTFQQEYQALLGAAKVPVGTPGRPCRVVASSNGSECGRGQPFVPYAELLRLDLDEELFDLSALGGTLASAITGLPIILLSGTYYLRANVRLNALPDQQPAEICRLEVRVDKTGGLFDLHYSLIDYHANSLAGQLPLDSSSGGVISLTAYAQQAGGGSSALLAGLLKQSQFCFVPTFSALNITPNGSAATRAQYSPGTSVGSPFANFRTAARENEGHLEYTALKSAWMLQELRQAPQAFNCLAFCQAAATISASPTAAVCSNTQFSIAGLPANATVRWQAEPQGLLVNSTFTGPVFTATASGAGSGEVRLQATVSSECGEFVVQRLVYVGAPEPADVQWVHEAGTCDYNMAYFHIANYSSVLTYAITNRVRAGGGSVQGPDFWVKASGVTSGSFTLTVSASGCGSSSTDVQVEYPPCTGPVVVYRLAPNPATDEVLVQPDAAPAASGNARAATASPGAPAGIATVRVYDGYGRLRLEQPGHGAASLRLRVGPLPAGLYVVHVLHGGSQVSRQQLQVMR